MTAKYQRKKQTTVDKDVIDIGLEQVTLEMSKLLKDFHRNLRNLSLVSLDNIKEPILKLKSEMLPIKRQLGLKAVVAPGSNQKSKEAAKDDQTANISNKNSVNTQNKGNSIKNTPTVFKQKGRTNSHNKESVNNASQNTHRKISGNSPNRGYAKRSPSSTSKKSSISNNSSKLSENLKKPVTPPRMQPIPLRTSQQSTLDNLHAIQEVLNKAKQEHKTFTVCGNYNSIRKALLDRGWIEKIRLSYNTRDRENLRRLQSMPINELITKVRDKEIGDACRRMIMSKLLYNHQVDFYWDDFNDAFKVNSDRIKYTLINKFKRTIFSYTSKQGLCEAVKRAHWYQKPGKAIVRHPRSYSLTDKGDPREFVEDYKTTAAISLLKWVLAISKQQKIKLISESGRIPLEAFHFAVEECIKVIKKAKHEDIDCEIEEALDYQWNQFLDCYYKLVHIGNHFKEDNKTSEQSIVQKAQYILSKLEVYIPNLDMDGMMNIWILKPIAGCRGQGIHICRTLQYILHVVKTNTNMRYVVQKYIEKPLLIYNTKFDIRQWFLISSASPLTIWIYKECYLRFSSQTYNLRKLHESIHLTNNSVQCKYKNTGRDIALPNYNMWDTNQFKNYLRNTGYPNAFDSVIYPGMKQCITGAILLNQDNIDARRNSFELYGADFMLTEDFQPWLIEINAKPALYASTPVTARMCPQVLNDLIKVIIDVPLNPKAKTGNFELLYKQNIPRMPKVDTEGLKLEGTPLKKEYFCEFVMSDVNDAAVMPRENEKIDEIQEYICKVKTEMHNALQNLLDVIETEKERRKIEKVSGMQFENKGVETMSREINEKGKQTELVVGYIEDCDSVEDLIISEEMYQYYDDDDNNNNNNGALQDLMKLLKNAANKSMKCT